MIIQTGKQEFTDNDVLIVDSIEQAAKQRRVSNHYHIDLRFNSHMCSLKDFNVLAVWQSIDASNTEICPGRNGVIQLAIRILSVTGNSAGCERTFSQFGIIHTKLRNRISPETVHKMTQVKLHLRRLEHRASDAIGEPPRKRQRLDNDTQTRVDLH